MSKNNDHYYFLGISITVLFFIYIIGKTYYPRKTTNAKNSFKKNEIQVFVKKTNIIAPKEIARPAPKIDYPFDVNMKQMIDIPTRSLDTTYRQVGVLKKIYGGDKILPLMGRPLYHKINQWQYYTTNETGTVQLPISKDGKTCSSKNGCFEIKNGQNVYVEGFDDVFKVNLIDD